MLESKGEDNNFIARLKKDLNDACAKLETTSTQMESLQLQNIRNENNFYEGNNNLNALKTRLAVLEQTTVDWRETLDGLKVTTEPVDTSRLIKLIGAFHANDFVR